MDFNSSQAINQEIHESAQKILKHLNEIAEVNEPLPECTNNSSDFVALLSSLQAEESSSLLADLNKWTENRCDRYQSYDKNLLQQVEKNQKLTNAATADAIPVLQDQMDEFDMKISNVKSHLQSLSEAFIQAIQNLLDSKLHKGVKTEIPHFQLNSQISSSSKSLNADNTSIYHNELIENLKKRQEYLQNILTHFDREIGAVQHELNMAKKYARKLKEGNKQLAKENEKLKSRPQLFTADEISMECPVISDLLEIHNLISFEKKFSFQNPDNDESIIHSMDSLTIEPDDKFVVIPRSEYNELSTNNKTFIKLQNEIKNGNFIRKQNSNDPNEVNLKMDINEKGELCLVGGDNGLLDGNGMRNEISRDLQQLLEYGIGNNDPSNSTDLKAKTFSGTQLKDLMETDDSNVRRSLDGSLDQSKFNSNNYDGQPIVPLGFRANKNENGDLGFRLFFKSNNDAIVIDTKFGRRTKDGLIIMNQPSPNIRIRVENGFHSSMFSRFNGNQNCNLILQSFTPEGMNDKIVGICENNGSHSNFIRGALNNSLPSMKSPLQSPRRLLRLQQKTGLEFENSLMCQSSLVTSKTQERIKEIQEQQQQILFDKNAVQRSNRVPSLNRVSTHHSPRRADLSLLNIEAGRSPVTKPKTPKRSDDHGVIRQKYLSSRAFTQTSEVE